MILDLSIPLDGETPVYPGDPPVRVRIIRRVEKDGYYMNLIEMSEHSGTHVDAPAHFIPEGETIDELSLELFFGKGVVLTPEEVGGNLVGKILLLLTSGGEIDTKTARRIAESGVKLVGIDSMSIGSEEVHKIILGAGIPIVENLRNLDMLRGREFWFFAFPLPIVNGSGSPVRAVALIPERENRGGLHPYEISLLESLQRS